MRRRSMAVQALVAALLMSGCGVLPGFSSDRPDGAGSASAAPAGPSWIVATQGSATPSAGPSGRATPTPSPASGFLPLGAPVPTRTPISTCSPNTFNFSKVAAMDVTPGATSAVLTWYNVGGYNLVEFRLYAISHDLKIGSQRDVGYVSVRPKTPCGRMSATIGNLKPGTAYVFSADAVVLRRSGDGTHSATVARSHPVRTK